MAGFRHNPDTGEREYQDGPAPDDAPASSGPPMQDPGWVEHFLNTRGPAPLPHSSRPLQRRPYGAKRRVR